MKSHIKYYIEMLQEEMEETKKKGLTSVSEKIKKEIDRIQRMAKKNPHLSFSEKVQAEIEKRKGLGGTDSVKLSSNKKEINKKKVPPSEKVEEQKKFTEMICEDTNEKISSYKDYLLSEHWKLKKQEYRESKFYKGCCEICKEKNVELHLHHKTYKNIGKERVEELSQLCKKCHSIVHKLGKIDFTSNKTLNKIKKELEKDSLINKNKPTEEIKLKTIVRKRV